MTGSNNYLNTNSVSGKPAYNMVQCAHLVELSPEEPPNSLDAYANYSLQWLCSTFQTRDSENVVVWINVVRECYAM